MTEYQYCRRGQYRCRGCVFVGVPVLLRRFFSGVLREYSYYCGVQVLSGGACFPQRFVVSRLTEYVFGCVFVVLHLSPTCMGVSQEGQGWLVFFTRSLALSVFCTCVLWWKLVLPRYSIAVRWGAIRRLKAPMYAVCIVRPCGLRFPRSRVVINHSIDQPPHTGNF